MCRGAEINGAPRPDGDPAFSAGLERGVPPRAPARAASSSGGLDADDRDARSVGVRRPPRSRSRSAGAARRCAIVRAPAWPCSVTRRSVSAISVCARSPACGAPAGALLARERFDALFITIYPVYPALLGAALKAEFGVPFVLDYQDPWVGAWGESVGGGPTARADWKSRASRRSAMWLEPLAVARGRRARRRVAGHARRHRRADPGGGAAAARRDPARIRAGRLRVAAPPIAACARFDPADGLVHLCYVGTLLPTGVDTLRLLLRALERARREDPAAARLRLHFFGTSNQSVADRVSRAADRTRVRRGGRGHRSAGTARLSRRAVRPDACVRRSCCSAAAERHYTASKLYPALLAKRPILALFHEASSVVVDPARRGVRALGARRHLRRRAAPRRAVGEVACHLAALAASCAYNPADVALDRAADVSARSLARQLAAVFDRVAA